MLMTANPLTIGNSFGYYSGIFSTAVTASVNPTATMAFLATLGAIENASVYSPDSAFFNTIADALNNVPVLNAAASLPIANPYAAVFLTVVAAIMIIIHSFAESKILSQATIDKLDKLTGWIGLTALSLMPLVTNDAVTKTDSSKHAVLKAASMADESVRAAASSAPWYTWVIGIITLIIASIVYFCCYSCVDNIGTICAAIPVKGLNIVEQIVKAILHAGMILLQLTFPALSFIVSIIVAILGILLFRILARITFYYKEVYARPILHRIFKKDKEVAKIHKKLPRRFAKKHPEAELAIPVFAFKGIKNIPSRAVLWLIIDHGKAHLLTKKSFFRTREIDITSLHESYPDLTLVETRRFLQLKTAQKQCNIVISHSYRAFADLIAEKLNVPMTSIIEVQNAVAPD